jgi:hypothetical protein
VFWETRVLWEARVDSLDSLGDLQLLKRVFCVKDNPDVVAGAQSTVIRVGKKKPLRALS